MRKTVQAVFVVGALAASVAGTHYFLRPSTRPALSRPAEPDPREKQLRASVENKPQDPELRVALITYLLSSGRKYDALDAARAASVVLPGQQAIQLALSDALVSTARIPEAIEQLRPLAGQHPAYRVRLARVLVRGGKPQEAVHVLAALSHVTPAIELEAGQVYLDALRPDRALPHLRRAVAAAPDVSDYAAHLGLALLLSGRYLEAANTLAAVLETAPEVGALQYYLGSSIRLTDDRNRLPEAMEHLQRAVTLEPDSALYHYELALCRAQLRNWEGAVHALQQAALLSPDTPEFQRDLARAYSRVHQPISAAVARSRYLRLIQDGSAAVQILEPLVKQYPNNQDLTFALAEALAESNQGPKAMTLLQQFSQRAENRSEVLRKLSRVAQQEGEPARALIWLDQASAHPEKRDLIAHADLLLSLARYKELEGALIRLRDADPGDAESHYKLGLAYSLWSERPDRNELAEASFRRSIALWPADSRAHYALAVVLERAKRQSEAVHELRKALDLQPSYLDALRLLGSTYAELGDRSRSQEAFSLFRRLQAAGQEEKDLEVQLKRPATRISARRSLYQRARQAGDLVTATSELEVLSPLLPGDKSLHHDLSLLYGHARRFQRMFEEQEQARVAGGRG